ncbi:MAG: hypothetical protein FWF10_01770 [Clostridiales bacterium]|nr:hypothetical protein [Clostridiales bacterium]
MSSSINYPGVPQTGAGANSSGNSGSGGFYVNSFEDLLQQMLSAYDPALVNYTPLDEQKTLLQIASWLRPAFDAAIEMRGKQTERAAAELDTDAYARGMGSSTFLSDVKARNRMDEADDVRAMESDYASKLAQYLYQAVETDRARALDVAKFNAEQTNAARAHAANAAQSAYASQSRGGGKSGGSGSNSKGSSAPLGGLGQGSADAKLGAEAMAFYRGLSSAQKKLFFDTGNLTYAKQRNAFLKAYGAQKFNALRVGFLKGN